MYVMAVRALHQSFIHAMPEWLVELCPDLLMAGVAEPSLVIDEQVLRFFRLMDVVTRCASHSGLGVRGTIERHVLGIGLVTLHATRVRFRLRDPLEGKNLRLVTARFHVCATGPVTGFACVPGFAASVLESSFVVRACFDLFELLLVTSLAGIGTHVIVIGRSTRLRLWRRVLW
jgi:hypothetical protein